jgi:hypothetical protein
MNYTVTVTTKRYRKSFTTQKVCDTLDYARNYSRKVVAPSLNNAGTNCNPTTLVTVRNGEILIATWTPSQKWTLA